MSVSLVSTDRRTPGRLMRVLLVLTMLITAPIAAAVPAAAAIAVTVSAAPGTITAHWSTIPGAVTYEVALWDGGDYVQIFQLDPPTTTYTFTSLDPYTYSVRMTALDSEGLVIDEGESGPVQVSAFEAQVGALVVSEFRQSGPAGTTDSYAVISNPTGIPQQLAGYVLSPGFGGPTKFPADGVRTLAPGASYLVTGPGYSLGAQATPDLTAAGLGWDGLQLFAPDTGQTTIDIVAPYELPGWGLGPSLPPFQSTPTGQFAWVRSRDWAGTLTNTRSNAADFNLVSTTGGLVGGVQSTLGAPHPVGLRSPAPTRGITAGLLDPGATASAAPNRVVIRTLGGPTTMQVRRVLTNNTSAPITELRLRITDLSQANGRPRTDVPNPAQLRVTNPATPSTVTTMNGIPLTVQNLSLDQPSGTGPGGGAQGGLNSTLTVALPPGGLPPGGSLPVAFTFTVDAGGTYWFTYDTEITQFII